MSSVHEYHGKEIIIVKMPLGETTADGPFYAKVDGHNIGINNRTHWDTEAATKLAAETYINGGYR